MQGFPSVLKISYACGEDSLKFTAGFRLALKRHSAWCRVRIRNGPLRGHRLSIGCGTRFWRGTYDHGHIQSFLACITPGATVYDVGAHVGYYTLAAAHTAGPSGHVVAFEPAACNVALLKGHLAANGVYNVTVEEACLARNSGHAGFTVAGTGSGRGHFAQNGEQRVRTYALDDYCANKDVSPPGVIKMDIEGAEHDALLGAATVLAEHRPLLFIAVHSEELNRKCTRLLTEFGYRVTACRKNTLFAERL